MATFVDFIQRIEVQLVRILFSSFFSLCKNNQLSCETMLILHILGNIFKSKQELLKQNPLQHTHSKHTLKGQENKAIKLGGNLFSKLINTVCTILYQFIEMVFFLPCLIFEPIFHSNINLKGLAYYDLVHTLFYKSIFVYFNMTIMHPAPFT